MTQMRRTGRIREHAPNNIAQFLHGNRQAHLNAWYVDQPHGSPGQTQQALPVGSSFIDLTGQADANMYAHTYLAGASPEGAGLIGPDRKSVV